ncbi:MAG: ribulose-phosphate 3-epimerase [Desulfobacteraceae bacterium]|nr:ribulose-phosphate 3-epimerase [Desulfobacteraceae bacterium]
MTIVAPSILSADFTILGQEIKAVEDGGADWIHIDVMDGQFVPNITYGPIIVKASKKATDLPLDVHLMIEKPDLIIPDFIKAGADLISVHAEACTHLHRTIQMIKNENVKAGVALNPATPIETVEWIMEEIDFIVVMSVNPGFGGQKFIKSSIKKIEKLTSMKEHKNPDLIIQVDGGVNEKTINDISNAGATSFVAGSYIFNADDYKKQISLLKDKA